MDNNAFPVIDSTLSPEHLAPWVGEKYGFADVSVCLLKTNMNHTYRVMAANETYILRVYNHAHRRFDEIAEEVKLLNDLRNVINVSYPIADVENKFIHEISAPEGRRYTVLFSFAKGNKIRHLTEGLNKRIGYEVGALHQHTQNKRIERVDYSVDRLIDRAYTLLSKYIPTELTEMKFIKSCGGILSVAFAKYPLRNGVVHIDVWYDNISVQNDGTITLFDFDNCGNGWLVLDIGYYCMQLFYTEPVKEVYEQKRAAFIEGYRLKTPVPDTELELIPYAGLAIWIYYLGVQAERFDNFANIFLSENYIRMMIDRVKTWLKYHHIVFP